MGFRQLIWALIAALLLYGGWQFLRALLAGRRAGRAARPMSAPARAQAEAPADANEDANEDADEIDEAAFNYAPMPAAGPPAATVPPTAGGGPDPFALELEVQRLRREIGALRAALDVQQDEIGALHEAVKRIGDAPPAVPAPAATVDRTGPNASPEYSEALVLARRGFSVEDVSARCGITRAEAELVVSLAARDGEGQA
ncbi:DUF2802 domain-containing protein [Azoarcus sp. L1K30]|uniref:DUF2802 domain-containing protein n=1 Tax=Azoarcus sp. L1K30 TaxID=2820277 RepID=UPI001B8348D3|nr:DUF2802 domain-containing protein [Azoarcus sp. L1K30]MBR0567945.1 DUF2802 domain-containing protein [Azoarcus sp. L1K30]